MIKFMKFRWAENESQLRKRFENMSDDELNRLSYKNLVEYICEDIINTFADDTKYIMGPTAITDRITEIDDGDYSGTLLFTIPFDVYQPRPNEYFMTYVEYGSCSVCDTLQGIYYKEREEQLNDYMKLCRDIASNFIVPYNFGWRENELFKEATVND